MTVFRIFPLFIYIIKLALYRLNNVATVYHQSKEEISTEYHLVSKCQQNPKYFAAIYEKYYEPLYLFVYKRVDNEAATDDLVAKVFMRCLMHIKQYKFQGVPFSAWMYKIAINEINQFFRKQKKLSRTVSMQQQHVDQLYEYIDHQGPQFDPNVIVAALLESLSAKELQFIELRFFEQYSFKEMAYLLGTTEGNAKIKTYRILDKLKKVAHKIKFN